MDFISVIVAALAAWAFGAVWYMVLARPWMEASGLTEEQVKAAGPLPYVISLVGAVLAAGMLRHVMAGAGVDTLGKALLTGLGTGLFLVAPWIANTVMYGLRDKRLLWIDTGYPIVGMTIMAAVLVLL